MELLCTNNIFNSSWSMTWPKQPSFHRQPVEHTIKQHPLSPYIFDDFYNMNSQSGTQWDGLRHFGHLGLKKLYNNLSPDEVLSGLFRLVWPLCRWRTEFLSQGLAVGFKPSPSMALQAAVCFWTITRGQRSKAVHMTQLAGMRFRYQNFRKWPGHRTYSSSKVTFCSFAVGIFLGTTNYRTRTQPSLTILSSILHTPVSNNARK